MQVFLQMVAFSLESDESGGPVLANGKRPKSVKSMVTTGLLKACLGLQNWQEFVTLMNNKAAAISKTMELPW